MTIVREILAIPNENDILCGQGSTCYRHKGNWLFQIVIALHLPKYTNSKTTRYQKTEIIQSIYRDQYKIGIRFLRKISEGWIILDNNQTLTKVGQSMRDEAAKMKRFLNTETGEVGSSIQSSKDSLYVSDEYEAIQFDRIRINDIFPFEEFLTNDLMIPWLCI